MQNDDFSRLVLTNTNGTKASEWLKQKGVYVEFCDASRVVFIISLAESEQNLLKLKHILSDMPSFEKPLFNDVQPDEVCSQLNHIDGQTVLVDICDADGYICANQCGGYPPCIPLFLHGEKITNANRLLGFADTFGLFDNKIKVFKK